MARFFVPTDAIEDTTAVIRGGDVLHITKVLRMKQGDTLTVCDGEKTDYFCEIAQTSKKEIILNILERTDNKCEPDCRVTLYQGVPKGAKMEYLIQKCVEVGIYRIVPVMTERTIAKGENKNERWNKVAEEAAKQSGRGIVPEVLPVMGFDDALDKMAGHEISIMPYEEEENRTLRSVLRGKTPSDIGVMIGPEGGFSENETKKAQEVGAVLVTLGKRILRTETAGMAVLSNIMYEFEQ